MLACSQTWWKAIALSSTLRVQTKRYIRPGHILTYQHHLSYQEGSDTECQAQADVSKSCCAPSLLGRDVWLVQQVTHALVHPVQVRNKQ